MTANTAPSLHDAILNLPCGMGVASQHPCANAFGQTAYKAGHKIALHAAAELAMAADAEIARLREALNAITVIDPQSKGATIARAALATLEAQS